MAQAQTQPTQGPIPGSDPTQQDKPAMTAKAARAILAAWQDMAEAYKDATGQPLTFGAAELQAAEYLGY